MRQNDLPCDIIGVEPGWQTHAYACTYVWNPEKFPEYTEKLVLLDVIRKTEDGRSYLP